MFGTKQGGAAAYASIGLETGVTAASPHKLVIMLFEGAMIAIMSAIQQMQSGDIAGKGQSISKAITIIDSGLRASLNKEVGGEIALNLDTLYEYMSNRLLIANLKNQPNVLQEVYELLKGLKDAWEKASPAGGNSSAPTEVAPPSAPDPYGQPATTAARLVKA